MIKTPPILFIIFNRPDKTARILDTIRKARPERLYVAADGPRTEKVGDIEACALTRAVIDRVDWDCKVITLFRDNNLGCRNAVSGAVTWFFDREPEGIVIEDDIELDPSFFVFAAEMLERYRDDPKIMSITACNMQPERKNYLASYYFSAYNHVWGWASWARAWQLYASVLNDLDSVTCDESIDAMCPVPGARYHWKRLLYDVHAGKIDTWDYNWLYSQWKSRGLTVTPCVNLMQNIGFDGSGTHTNDPNAYEASLRKSSLRFPLIHPEIVFLDAKADLHVSLNVSRIRPRTFLSRLNRWRKGDRLAWI